MSDVAGRTVVVAGAGRAGQVGELVARAFAARGAALVLLGRDADALDAQAELLRAAGAVVHAHAADLTDARALEPVARAVSDAAGGRAHALVHVAGGFAASGPVAESDVEVWHRTLASNLTSAYVTTRAFLPLLRAARGSVLYFSSVAALPGAKPAGLAAYAAAKAGVLSLMRTVAAEERASGVRANALAPAAIRTATNEASMGADAAYVERDALADVVVYLASDAARGVTGQVVQMG